MRAHQAVGMNLDFAPVNGTSQPCEEEAVVLTPLEESAPRYGAVEDVMPLARFVLAGDARHELRDGPRSPDS